jgi:hypothetical protein
MTHAEVMGRQQRLPRPVSLERLRLLNRACQPPQFFQHLDGQSPLMTVFNGSSESIATPQARRSAMSQPTIACS